MTWMFYRHLGVSQNRPSTKGTSMPWQHVVYIVFHAILLFIVVTKQTPKPILTRNLLEATFVLTALWFLFLWWGGWTLGVTFVLALTALSWIYPMYCYMTHRPLGKSYIPTIIFTLLEIIALVNF